MWSGWGKNTLYYSFNAHTNILLFSECEEVHPDSKDTLFISYPPILVCACSHDCEQSRPNQQ